MPTPEQSRKIKQLERTCGALAETSTDLERIASFTEYRQESQDVLVTIPGGGRYVIDSQGNIKLMLP